MDGQDGQDVFSGNYPEYPAHPCSLGNHQPSGARQSAGGGPEGEAGGPRQSIQSGFRNGPDMNPNPLFQGVGIYPGALAIVR